jgi:glycosyltransferase involved in cell wall biosynthesis
MSRCPACPAAPGDACPGAVAPRVCRLVAEVPRYREAVARRASGTPRAELATFPPRLPGDGRARVGFLCDTRVRTGGTETWHDLLYRVHDGSRLHLAGMAVRHLEPGAGTLPDGSAAHAGADAMRALAASVDVLCCWGVGDLAAILPARGDPRRPAVVAVSHGEPRCAFTRKWLETCAGDCDAFAAVSEGTRATIPGAHRAGATIIPNAYDPAKVRPTRSRAEARAELGIPGDAFVALYNGRLAGDKRPMLAVDAMKRAGSRLCRLVVAGSGHLESDLRAAADGSPFIHFLGHRSDTADLLVASDVLLNPSEVEGFGLSMLEALVAGVRVIATAKGLAEVHPDWFLTLPVDAGAAEWARIIGLAHMDTYKDVRGERPPILPALVAERKAAAEALYGPAAFGRRWSDFLASLARPGPAPAPARPTVAESWASLRAARACRHRGCRTGCQTSHCAKFDRSASLAECLACPSQEP